MRAVMNGVMSILSTGYQWRYIPKEFPPRSTLHWLCDGTLDRSERAKTEFSALVPEDAKEAFGHGVRAKRSKAGAVSFDVIETVEASHAPVE
jgi:transposase